MPTSRTAPLVSEQIAAVRATGNANGRRSEQLGIALALAVAVELAAALEGNANGIDVLAGDDPGLEARSIRRPVQKCVVVSFELVLPEFCRGQEISRDSLLAQGRQQIHPPLHIGGGAAAVQ